MRLILFDRLGNELRDVCDVLSCHRHERLDGTDELNFETLDDVEKGQRLLLKDSIGNYHEYVIGSIDETHDGESAPIKAVWAESAMAHDFRFALQLIAYSLRRTRRQDELGKLCLERLEAFDERVVFMIENIGRRLHVVELVATSNFVR